MKNSNPVIQEISSDDEASFVDASGSGGGDDHDWLSELLDEMDRCTDDSDDVVVVDEVVVKPKKSRLNSSAKSVNYNGGYDDDDCVILDGDPDKPLVVENNKVDDEGSDDLLVVGEKGAEVRLFYDNHVNRWAVKHMRLDWHHNWVIHGAVEYLARVACRDFPHPRHLCVTFPFASTPHDTHCDRCHCYVCDSLAPCVHWSSSISSVDHCHATDKEEFWRTERKSMKESDKTQQILNVSHVSLVPSSPPVQANSSAQNLDINRVAVRPRTHFGIPNITNQGRSQPSRSAVPSYQPYLVSKQLHSSTHNRRDLSWNRRHIVGSRGPQFITQCTAFKRSGPARVDSVNDRHGSGISKNCYRSQVSNNLSLPRHHASRGKVHMGASDYAKFASHESQVSSQTSLSSPVTNAIPSQPQVSSQGYRSNFLKADSLQSQIAPPSYARNHFQNTTIPLRPLVSQSNEGNTFHPVPSQTHGSTPLYTGNTFEHPLSPMSSQPNMDSTYGCFVSSQPQGYTEPTLPNGQNIFQQENQMQSGLDSNFTDYGFSSVPPVSGCNHQIPAGSSQLQNPAPAADNSPHQSVVREVNFQFQGVSPEVNWYGHVTVPEDNFSLIDDINSRYPGIADPDSLDFQFNTWMFENQSFPGALEVSVPPGLNVYSPEPGTIDAGALFDF